MFNWTFETSFGYRRKCIGWEFYFCFEKEKNWGVLVQFIIILSAVWVLMHTCCVHTRSCFREKWRIKKYRHVSNYTLACVLWRKQIDQVERKDMLNKKASQKGFLPFIVLWTWYRWSWPGEPGMRRVELEKHIKAVEDAAKGKGWWGAGSGKWDRRVREALDAGRNPTILWWEDPGKGLVGRKLQKVFPQDPAWILVLKSEKFPLVGTKWDCYGKTGS